MNCYQYAYIGALVTAAIFTCWQLNRRNEQMTLLQTVSVVVTGHLVALPFIINLIGSGVAN